MFDAYKGTCYLSGILIAGKPWELEHVKPLHMGGLHAESNLAPALKDYHAIKSAAEQKIKAKADRQARAASNTRQAPARKIQSAPMAGSSKPPRERKATLPFRRMFVDC